MLKFLLTYFSACA